VYDTLRPDMEDKTQYVTYSLRLTRAQLEAAKDLHARTYPEHRLSFNAWALRRLLEGGK
jgi:hypothetical protein